MCSRSQIGHHYIIIKVPILLVFMFVIITIAKNSMHGKLLLMIVPVVVVCINESSRRCLYQ